MAKSHPADRCFHYYADAGCQPFGGYTIDYGMLMLGVFICTVPTAVIFFCLQKSFAEGITGAVK